MKKLLLAAALGLALPLVAPAAAEACPCSGNKDKVVKACEGTKGDKSAKQDSKKKAKKKPDKKG